MTTITAGQYRDMSAVLALIGEQADKLVRDVNPGQDFTAPWFAPKVAEVRWAMTWELGMRFRDMDRPDLVAKLQRAIDKQEG